MQVINYALFKTVYIDGKFSDLIKMHLHFIILVTVNVLNMTIQMPLMQDWDNAYHHPFYKPKINRWLP